MPIPGANREVRTGGNRPRQNPPERPTRDRPDSVADADSTEAALPEAPKLIQTRNLEAYRAYQREYQRKLRARAREKAK